MINIALCVLDKLIKYGLYLVIGNKPAKIWVSKSWIVEVASRVQILTVSNSNREYMS